MPLPANNNNKESFRLLDLSSDMSSEDLQLEIAPAKKKKLHRKGRSRSTPRPPDVPIGEKQWRRSILYAVYAAVLTWLVVLTYTVTALNQRLNGFDEQLRIVSTSSDSVSDALQHCHSASKELRANTSALSERLSQLTAEHGALVDRLEGASASINALETKLADMPDLTKAPVRLQDLVKMVGELGSRLSGVDVAVKAAHDTARAAQDGLDALRTAVGRLTAATNSSAAERKQAAERLRQLTDGIAALNETVLTRLNGTERRLKEYSEQLQSLSRSTTPPPAAPSPAPLQEHKHTVAPNDTQKTITEGVVVTTATPTASSTGVPSKPGVLESRP